MNTVLIKQVSAWLPIASSGVACVAVLTQILVGGAARATDEGAAAHIWQLLMVGQVPIIAFFLFRWLPQAPARTWRIVAVQVLAALVAIAPVAFFGL